MIRAGKCKRQEDGRITLPNGSLVPRNLPGANMKEQIDEWHKQSSVSTLIFQVPDDEPSSVMLLSKEEHLESLRQRIAAVEAQDADNFAFTRAKRPVQISEPRPAAAQPVTRIPSPPIVEIPEHPFHKAKDVTYLPPSNRVVGAKPAPKKTDKADGFKRSAPAQNSEAVHRIFDEVLNVPITTNLHDLLATSPDFRNVFKEFVVPKRVPVSSDPVTSVLLNAQEEGAEISAFQFSEADGLVVGQNKLALRTVFPVVNYRGHVEAILDPGCQIIAMSEKCAQELGLMYDPAITISMQSANGGVTPTKGMAHNVPFAFGNITLFLQVHIMEMTVYDVLLGRPFDALARTEIRNSSDDMQSITICDPNSDTRIVVPTRPRGKRLDEQFQLTNLIFEVADTKSRNTTHRSKIGRTQPAPSRIIDDDDEEEEDYLWQGFWDSRI